MINGVLDFFRNLVANRSQQQRRIRQYETVKTCRFCQANIPCHKKVCKNCYMPLASSLAGEKWISQELSRKVNCLEAMDGVKYNRSGVVASPAV